MNPNRNTIHRWISSSVSNPTIKKDIIGVIRQYPIRTGWTLTISSEEAKILADTEEIVCYCASGSFIFNNAMTEWNLPVRLYGVKLSISNAVKSGMASLSHPSYSTIEIDLYREDE